MITEEQYQEQLPVVEAACNSARTRVLEAKAKLQLKRKASAVAITAWNVLTPQPTQREMIAAVAATQPARDAYAARQVAQPKFQIDRVMQHRARGATVNVGYNRPMRGLKA